MNDCIFCKIIRKEIPSNIVYESEDIIAFPDINPAADTHILIVPKKHLDGVQDLNKEDGNLLADIFSVVNKLVTEYNLAKLAYRVSVNGGKAQHVPHLHFHLLGGNLKKTV